MTLDAPSSSRRCVNYDTQVRAGAHGWLRIFQSAGGMPVKRKQNGTHRECNASLSSLCACTHTINDTQPRATVVFASKGLSGAAKQWRRS